MTYVYYVAYLFATDPQGRSGNGFARVERDNPIATFDDVVQVKTELEEQGNVSGLTILQWKRLD